MRPGLEATVTHLLKPTLDCMSEEAKAEESIQRTEAELAAQGMQLRVNESLIPAWFVDYSGEAGKLVGSDRGLEVAIITTLEEQIEVFSHQIERELPPFFSPHLLLAKKAAARQLSAHDFESFLNASPMLTLAYLTTHLSAHTNAMYTTLGAAVGGKVFLNLCNIIKEVFVTFTNSPIDKQRLDIAGLQKLLVTYVKHILTHESAHAHLPELGERASGLAYRADVFLAEAFRRIFALGKSLNGLTSKAQRIQFPLHSTPERLSCLFYLNAYQTLQHFTETGRMPGADEFRPLPREIREYIASNAALVAALRIAILLNEGSAEFVTRTALGKRGEAGLTAQMHKSFNVNERYSTAIPLISALYAKRGKHAFDILAKMPLPDFSEFRKPELYVARVGAA